MSQNQCHCSKHLLCLSGCLGPRVDGGRDLKGAQGNSEPDGCVLYLDCGNGFLGVYLSKSSEIQPLDGCRLWYINSISIRVLAKKINSGFVHRDMAALSWCDRDSHTS